MTAVGEQMGVQISHLLSAMDEPLGRTVGNALEVAEAVETLQGRGPSDLVELTLDLAAKVATAPRAQLARWLADGTAWRKFVALVEAQDGDAARAGENGRDSSRADHSSPARAPQRSDRRAWTRRRSAVRHFSSAPAGRRADDKIDFAVGFSQIRQPGERIEKEEPLMLVHARTENDLASAWPLLERATQID